MRQIRAALDVLEALPPPVLDLEARSASESRVCYSFARKRFHQGRGGWVRWGSRAGRVAGKTSARKSIL